MGSQLCLVGSQQGKSVFPDGLGDENLTHRRGTSGSSRVCMDAQQLLFAVVCQLKQRLGMDGENVARHRQLVVVVIMDHLT